VAAAAAVPQRACVGRHLANRNEMRVSGSDSYALLFVFNWHFGVWTFHSIVGSAFSTFGLPFDIAILAAVWSLLSLKNRLGEKGVAYTCSCSL